MGRLVLFGIDGLSYTHLPKILEHGVMPNCAELVRQTPLVRMRSSLPEVSSTAWSSIITGTGPGEHNVYGFTDIIDGSYGMGFTSFQTLKTVPFWARDDSKRHLIINVPQTFPAANLNGTLISGYVALDLERSVTPKTLLPTLTNDGYRIDADMSLAGESKEAFFAELKDVLAARVRVLNRLWAQESWDTVFFVVTGTDRLCHYFWDQWEDANAPHHRDFLEFFHDVDQVIGSILERLSEDDTFILLSDHGFEAETASLNVNDALKQNGFLSFETTDPRSLADISSKSLAFSLDPGRIYLHSKDRYPRGCVTANSRSSVLKELRVCLEELTVGRQKAIHRIYEGSELYSGPYAHRAPDLVLLAESGISLNSRIRPATAQGQVVLTGKHAWNDAVFLLRSPRTATLPEPMTVESVQEVINQACK